MRLNFTRAMCLVILLLPLSLKAQMQVGMSDVLRPVDYTTDGTNQYVLTEYNIQVFSKTGTLVRKIALPGDIVYLPRPVAIAYKDGKLFVADGTNAIYLISTDGTFLKGININTTPLPDNVGHDLHDIEILGNTIYTTDRIYVRTYSLDGVPIATFGGAGSGNGQFQNAWKLTVDENGDYYVTDAYLGRVQKFNSSGVFLGLFATQGNGVGQLATPAMGIASDGAGSIYVSEPNSNFIHQFTTGGAFVKKFNGGGPNLEYVAPNIVSVEKPDRVVAYNKNGTVLSTLGGHSSDAGKFNYPTGVAFDTQGNFYVADRDNYRVQVFNNKGQFIRQFGSYGLNDNQFTNLASVAVAKDGTIHAVDGSLIKTFNNNGTLIKSWGSYGSGGAGQFLIPGCVTVDKDDNIWIADTYNQRVQVFDKNLQFIKMINVHQLVRGVAVDDAGNMYIPDQSAGVLKYDVNGNISEIGRKSPNVALAAFGVTIKGNKIYVLSRSGVSIYDLSGNFIANNRNWGAEPNEFVSDFYGGYSSIAIGPTGDMVISDLLRVQIIKDMNYITMETFPAKTYGDPAFTITATSTSGLPVTLESSDPTIASVDGKTVTIKKAGNVVITAKQAGDLNNNIPVASPASQTLNIYKAEQKVTLTAVPDKRWGDADFKLSATSSGDGKITYSSSNNGIFSVSSDVAHIEGLGSAFVTATASETENYLWAQTSQIVKVSKGLQTITFDPIPPKILKDKEVVLPEFTSAGKAIQYISSDNNIVSVSGNVATLKAIGSVNIFAYGPGDQFWEEATPVIRQLTVSAKRPSQLTFPAIDDKHYGDEPFELVASASSGLPVTFQSGDESIITVEGNIATIRKPGETYILAWAGGNDEYESTVTIFQRITVGKGIPSIDFKPIPEKIFIKDETFRLEATNDLDLPITFLIDNNEVATVNDNVVTLVAPGTTTVRAITQETDLYSAGEALQTLVVKLVTGIEEVEPSGMIYPNPATDYVYVRGKSQAVVINSIGQILYAPIESVNKDLQKVDVSQLKAGIYFIKINNKAYKLVKE